MSLVTHEGVSHKIALCIPRPWKLFSGDKGVERQYQQVTAEVSRSSEQFLTFTDMTVNVLTLVILPATDINMSSGSQSANV